MMTAAAAAAAAAATGSGNNNSNGGFLERTTAATMTGQAVPSVSPGQAALYFNKMECFCFNQQVLTAGQKLLMPLQFYVDPALPEQFSTITLSYTLYDMTKHSQPETVAALIPTGGNHE